MQNRTEKIKLIAGRLLRSPALTSAQAQAASGDARMIARFMIENAVAAGLAYRDSEDVQVPLDIAEARALVESYRGASAKIGVGARLDAADKMADYIEALAKQAAVTFGEKS